MDSEMEQLERAIMSGLLANETPVADALRAQWAEATVARREYSGVGFFTHFAVAPSCPMAVPANLEIGDEIRLEGMGETVGVQLFVRDGVLSMLEGFTHTQAWPEHPVFKEWVSYPT